MDTPLSGSVHQRDEQMNMNTQTRKCRPLRVKERQQKKPEEKHNTTSMVSSLTNIPFFPHLFYHISGMALIPCPQQPEIPGNGWGKTGL
jgi:hypothetical protein